MLMFPAWTSRAEVWRFGVFGDIRSEGKNTPGYPVVSTPVVHAFAAALSNDHAVLAIVNGDLITGQTSWSSGMSLPEMFDVYTNAMTPFHDAGIVLYELRGNHETYHTNGVTPSNAWLQAIGNALPQNGPEGEKGFTYSFAFSNAFFVLLDQYGGGKSERGSPYPCVNQAWMDAQLGSNTLPHAFVFAHEAAFQMVMTCMSSHPVSRTACWDSLGTHGVRTLFCGHDHFYCRTLASVSNGPALRQIVVGACTFDLMSWDGVYPEQGSHGVDVQTEAYFGLSDTTGIYRITGDTNVVLTGFSLDGWLAWTNPMNGRPLTIESTTEPSATQWVARLQYNGDASADRVKVREAAPEYGYMLVEINDRQVTMWYKSSSDLVHWETNDMFSYTLP